MDRVAHRPLVGGAHVPRLGVVEVLVAEAGEVNRLLHGLAHVKALVRRADLVRERSECVEHRPVGLAWIVERRHDTVGEAVGEGERAVDEVAEDVGEFGVDVGLEIVPREVSVLRLRQRLGEGVAEQVGREVVEGFVEPHGPAATRRELAAFEVEELVGGHVGGKDEAGALLPRCLVVRHQQRGEDERVEDDVVFSDKVEQIAALVLPVATPQLRVALPRGPFFRGRDVADRRVEPDVEHLALGVFDGHRHAPREVARHRAVGEAVGEPAFDLPAHVRLPPRMLVDPRFEAGLEVAEREVPVRRGADLGHGVGERAAGVDQFLRGE